MKLSRFFKTIFMTDFVGGLIIAIKEIFKSGLKVYTWTVNDKDDIKRMKELGVNGIITDFPERI